jgi:hypothetical protein
MICKIGTIIEIATAKGFAYAQYTHKHKEYGPLIRVMKGLHENPQTNLELLANTETIFSIFIPLGTALRYKDLKKIGYKPVPLFAQKFPIFKQGFADPKIGKVASWTLWDGEKSWLTQELSEDEKNYPLLRIASFDTLKSRIEEQWTPASDFLKTT